MATHKITAELYDNPLTDIVGDFTARPIIKLTLYNKDIAQRIVTKRTEYRPETIANILQMADSEKAEAVAEGNSVVDGMGQYMANIKGAFDSATAGFNREIHSLGVSYNPGKDLRKMLADTEVSISKTAVTGPVIGKITDAKTKSVNDLVSSNLPVNIEGNNIKLAGEDPSVGVYFVSDEDPTTSLKCEVISINNPSLLSVVVPQLTDGKLYRLRIVTQYGSGGKMTKEPRTTEYLLLLTADSHPGGGGEDDRPVIE